VTQASAPPQLSPDGQWWWDGYQWVPAAPYGGYGPYAPPAHSDTDGFAIASLVCSIASMGIGSVAGVVLGHTSRAKARRENREPSGLALAGLIIGYIGIGILVLILGVLVIGTFVSAGFVDQITSTGPEPSGPAADALHSAAQAEDGYLDDHGVYASSTTLLYPYGYEDADGISVRVAWIAGSTYCLAATDTDQTLWLSTDDPDVVTVFPCEHV
jgi:hypothetical protein